MKILTVHDNLENIDKKIHMQRNIEKYWENKNKNKNNKI